MMGLVQENCCRSPRWQEKTQEHVYATSFARAEQPMPCLQGHWRTEPQNSPWLTATHQAVIAIFLSPAKRAFSSHAVLRKIPWLEREGLESWLAGSCQRARLTHCPSFNRQHQNTKNKFQQDLSTQLSAAGKAAHRSATIQPSTLTTWGKR